MLEKGMANETRRKKKKNHYGRGPNEKYWPIEQYPNGLENNEKNTFTIFSLYELIFFFLFKRRIIDCVVENKY